MIGGCLCSIWNSLWVLFLDFNFYYKQHIYQDWRAIFNSLIIPHRAIFSFGKHHKSKETILWFFFLWKTLRKWKCQLWIENFLFAFIIFRTSGQLKFRNIYQIKSHFLFNEFFFFIHLDGKKKPQKIFCMMK